MHTFSYERHPAVARNTFRQRRYQPEVIPSFTDVRERLPRPILPDHPEWLEMYWRAWDLVWQHLRRPRPESGFITNYLDAARDGRMYLDDAVFMTQFGVYGRRLFSFLGTLDNFYARQHDDGYICRAINTADGLDYFYPFDPNGSGPNLCAWGEWRNFRQSGDRERIAAVFWPLLGLHDWFHRQRTWPSGLYWATGLSGSPFSLRRIPGGATHHRHWTWLDANLHAALNCATLAKMAELLGEKAVAAGLTAELAFLNREINARLWDEESRFYKDLSRNGHFSEVKSVVAFWSLLVPGLLDDGRRAALVKHLRDDKTFGGPFPLPTQAADDPGFAGDDDGTPAATVNPSSTYVALKGLRSIGQHRLAHEMARRHLAQIGAVFAHTNTFWQTYAADAERQGVGARPDFTGAGALAPIAVLIEDVIGMQVDWPRRRILWDRRLDGHYGVANLPLGPSATVTLIGDAQRVQVTTTVPLTLVLQSAAGTTQTAIPAGESDITLGT